MVAKYEPCSICEEYIEGVACTKDQCPVAKMKAENERLEKRLEEEKHALFEQQAYTAKLQAEIERLEGESNETFHKWEILAKSTKDHYAELYEEAKGVVRAEAIKEFAERIEPKLAHNTDISAVGYQSVIADIQSVVKEMTEGKDGNV